jgi:hypothetical protein
MTCSASGPEWPCDRSVTIRAPLPCPQGKRSPRRRLVAWPLDRGRVKSAFSGALCDSSRDSNGHHVGVRLGSCRKPSAGHGRMAPGRFSTLVRRSADRRPPCHGIGHLTRLFNIALQRASRRRLAAAELRSFGGGRDLQPGKKEWWQRDAHSFLGVGSLRHGFHRSSE